MNRINTTLLLLFCSVYCLAQQATIPVPKPFQLKWHQAEMGAVFHYDLHVFDGVRYGQGNNRINPIEDYNIFNPTANLHPAALAASTHWSVFSSVGLNML